MKPLTWLVLALLLAPSVRASPSGEDFVIETIKESEQISAIQQAVPLMPLPDLPPSPAATETDVSSKLIQVVQGAASWYGPGFYGRTTANGERFRKGTLTAAHRTPVSYTHLRAHET